MLPLYLAHLLNWGLDLNVMSHDFLLCRVVRSLLMLTCLCLFFPYLIICAKSFQHLLYMHFMYNMLSQIPCYSFPPRSLLVFYIHSLSTLLDTIVRSFLHKQREGWKHIRTLPYYRRNLTLENYTLRRIACYSPQLKFKVGVAMPMKLHKTNSRSDLLLGHKVICGV